MKYSVHHVSIETLHREAKILCKACPQGRPKMLTVMHIVLLSEYKGNCALGGTDPDRPHFFFVICVFTKGWNMLQ